LVASSTTVVTKRWLLGLGLVSKGLLECDTSLKIHAIKMKWQPLLPVMVRSFQLAREMILKVTFSDQSALDSVNTSGLAAPLTFLKLFSDVAATWHLRCALQAVQLLFSQRERQRQYSATADIPPAHFLAPSSDRHLIVIKSTAFVYSGEDQYCFGSMHSSLSQNDLLWCRSVLFR